VLKWNTLYWVLNICIPLLHQNDENRLLGRPRCGQEDNIKVDLQEVGLGGMDWIALAQYGDRCQVLVNAVLNLQIP
jgi:hypothetical protein